MFLYLTIFYIVGIIVSLFVYTLFFHNPKENSISDGVTTLLLLWPITLIILILFGLLFILIWPFEKLFQIALKYKRLKSGTHNVKS